jgi:branched-subunit amino acid aminotransferase/4-amino-4-deoxychorismate lyase
MREGPAAPVAVFQSSAFRIASRPLEPRLWRGEGLFETIRIREGVPLYVPAHVARLLASARDLGFPAPPRTALTTVERSAARLARRLGLSDARCRLLFAPPLFALAIDPLERLDGASGGAVSIAPWQRSTGCPVHRHKTMSQLENVLALEDARRHRCFDALFLDRSEHLLEGARTNVFLVAKGIVETPPLSMPILPGTTRQRLLAILRQARIPIRERRVSIEDLAQCREVFLTNALRGVIPVGRVGSRPVGRSSPGPVTREAARLLEAADRAETARARRSILQRARRDQ